MAPAADLLDTVVVPVRPSLARLLALLLVLLALAAVSAASALAAVPRPSATAISVVASGPDHLSDLMPGDELPVTTLEVRAQGSLRYTLSARTSGSPLLPSLLIVTIRTASGDILYEGSLADARVGDGSAGPSGGRILRDTTETLSISGHLSTDAGNEVQGAELSVTWVVQATELPTE